MGWKNLPYWLRGGIVALIIAIILLVPSLIIESIPLYIFNLDFIGLIIFQGSILNEDIFGVFQLITLAISYFIIGALIGLIIGKIKSKRQNEVTTTS